MRGSRGATRCVWVVAAVVLAGCGAKPPAQAATPRPADSSDAPDPRPRPADRPATVDVTPPSTPAPGLRLRVVQHGARTFRVAEVDLRVAELHLYGQTPGQGAVRTFTDLADWLKTQDRTILWGTNAGIFSKALRPLGLHVERGVEQVPINGRDGSGNFYLKPNGVFRIDAGRASVEPTAESPPETPWLATQSGPLLVHDGQIHPAFMPRSPNILLRSGVGVRDPHTVVFAISEGGTRFVELATLFRDALGCGDALYLDGVISQWVDPENPPGPTDGGFAGMFVVTASR